MSTSSLMPHVTHKSETHDTVEMHRTCRVPIKYVGSPDGRNVRLVPTWDVLNHLTMRVMDRTYFADSSGNVWIMPDVGSDPMPGVCPNGLSRAYTAAIYLSHYTPGHLRNARVVEIETMCRELSRKITDGLNAQGVYYGRPVR